VILAWIEMRQQFSGGIFLNDGSSDLSEANKWPNGDYCYNFCSESNQVLELRD
jgi:hypothetical protein